MQTKGEYRVGTAFNPSASGIVDQIKSKAADLIGPERIYLDGDVEAGDGMFSRCFEDPKYCSEPPVEYVRADALTAQQKRIKELEAALERISCHHVTEGPLWWQEEARAALAGKDEA